MPLYSKYRRYTFIFFVKVTLLLSGTEEFKIVNVVMPMVKCKEVGSKDSSILKDTYLLQKLL